MSCRGDIDEARSNTCRGCGRHQILSCGQSWHGAGMLGMAPDTTTGGRVGIAAEPDTSTQVVSAHAMCYGHEFAGNQLQATPVSKPQNVPRSSNKAAGTQHEPIASAPVAGRKNKFGNSRTSFYLSRPGLVLVARCRACITQTSLPLRISMCPVFA